MIKKSLIVVSILANLCFAGYFAYKVFKMPEVKKMDYSEINNQKKYNKARADIFNYLTGKKNEIVFIGTSLTEGFPLNEMFKNTKVRNRGIAGNTLVNMYDRLPEIIVSHPQRIILEGGINDIQANAPVDTIIKRYEKIIDRLSKQGLDKILCIQSVLPVRHYTIIQCNSKITECNERLRELCLEKKVVYLDFYGAFNKNGILSESLTYDGLHLNIEGYKVWSKLISKELHI